MTFKFMRPALAIALALGLAACGGKASFTIGGTIEGLQYDGLVLTTNGMDLAVVAKSTTFSFPNTLSYGDKYSVTVKTPPAHQSCVAGAFVDAAGKVHGAAEDAAGRLAAIDIGVKCVVNTFALGGTITGLTSDGLVLTNGSLGGTFTATATATAFSLPAVPYGVTYGVTVLTQPANAVCTVSPNGTGMMGDAAVADIVVSCVPKT